MRRSLEIWCQQIKKRDGLTSYNPASFLDFFLFFCRLLPDRLGVLLHGGRGGGGNAAVHLAVLFCREEAEALPVLKRAPERQARADGATKWRRPCDSMELADAALCSSQDSPLI